jgi:hypothetical protein
MIAGEAHTYLAVSLDIIGYQDLVKVLQDKTVFSISPRKRSQEAAL